MLEEGFQVREIFMNILSSIFPARSSVQVQGVILVAMAAIFFSAKAIFVKMAYQYSVDTVTLMTLRMGFSLPFYLITGWLFANSNQTPLTQNDYFKVIAIGVCGYYLASLFDLNGLRYISASFERLILYLYPTMVLLISAVIFKKKILRKEKIALVVGYLGIAVIFLYDQSLQGDDILLGTINVLLSALAFAVFIVGSGQLGPRIGSVRFTTIAMVAASVVIGLHFLLTHPISALRVASEVYWIALAIAVISTVIPTYLMAAGINKIGANQGALVGAIGPVSTMVMAYFILGEVLTPIHIVGMVLVLVSVISISLKAKKTN